MEYSTLLDRIIDDGIEAASLDYKNKPRHLKGAIDGFEACRNKQPAELLKLLTESNKFCGEAYFNRDADTYWEIRCFAAEVEWVCNVISAALVNQGESPIIPPTVRGVMNAARILGTD